MSSYNLFLVIRKFCILYCFLNRYLLRLLQQFFETKGYFKFRTHKIQRQENNYCSIHFTVRIYRDLVCAK